MLNEMTALHSNGTYGTWDLAALPDGKTTIGCRRVNTVNVGPDGNIDRVKSRLTEKGHTQIFGLEYGGTFSPVAKIASIHLFLAI